jgi:hypothetical protein
MPNAHIDVTVGINSWNDCESECLSQTPDLAVGFRVEKEAMGKVED